MEELINQAFAHIENVGPHVREGHYDLEGPEGELILKNIWSTTIQPGWQITMKMWPNLDLHPVRGQGGQGGQPAFRFPPNILPEHRQMFIQQQRQRMAAAQQQQNANARGHHGHRVQQPPPGIHMNLPPMAGQRQPPMPPPGGQFPMFPGPRGQQVPPEIEVLDVRKEGRKSRDNKKKKTALNWFGGRTVAGSSKR